MPNWICARRRFTNRSSLVRFVNALLFNLCHIEADTVMPNLRDYMTIKEAAEYLGVAPNTLRNWGRSGKIQEHRNPLNGYRLYRRAALDRLMQRIKSTGRRKPR